MSLQLSNSSLRLCGKSALKAVVAEDRHGVEQVHCDGVDQRAGVALAPAHDRGAGVIIEGEDSGAVTSLRRGAIVRSGRRFSREDAKTRRVFRQVFGSLVVTLVKDGLPESVPPVARGEFSPSSSARPLAPFLVR